MILCRMIHILDLTLSITIFDVPITVLAPTVDCSCCPGHPVVHVGFSFSLLVSFL